MTAVRETRQYVAAVNARAAKNLATEGHLSKLRSDAGVVIVPIDQNLIATVG